MHFPILLALPIVGSFVGASPTPLYHERRAVSVASLAQRDSPLPVAACGTPPKYSYNVPGISSRKQAIFSAGGDQFDISIAMQEVENMTSTYLEFDNKGCGDTGCVGIFKQNWWMLRTCCDKFKGQQESQCANALELNNDLTQDITCRHQCQQQFGLTNWLEGHAGGQSAINNPGAPYVEPYMNGVLGVNCSLSGNPSQVTDDTRLANDIPAH